MVPISEHPKPATGDDIRDIRDASLWEGVMGAVMWYGRSETILPYFQAVWREYREGRGEEPAPLEIRTRFH